MHPLRAGRASGLVVSPRSQAACHPSETAGRGRAVPTHAPATRPDPAVVGAVTDRAASDQVLRAHALGPALERGARPGDSVVAQTPSGPERLSVLHVS